LLGRLRRQHDRVIRLPTAPCSKISQNAGPCRCHAACHAWAAATTDPQVITSPRWASTWREAVCVGYHPGGAGLTVGRVGLRVHEDAGVRDARLHDARHTAATVLMLLGVPDRVIDQIMGWEPGTSARLRARYLHVPDAMLKDVARKIADAIWGRPETPPVDKDQDNAV
jgi:hypothetical protein